MAAIEDLYDLVHALGALGGVAGGGAQVDVPESRGDLVHGTPAWGRWVAQEALSARGCARRAGPVPETSEVLRWTGRTVSVRQMGTWRFSDLLHTLDSRQEVRFREFERICRWFLLTLPSTDPGSGRCGCGQIGPRPGDVMRAST